MTEDKRVICEYELDGKKIALHRDAEVMVQIGKDNKHRRGKYNQTVWFKGSTFGQAVMHYNMINIGNGYKKRLYVSALTRPTVAREFSI